MKIYKYLLAGTLGSVVMSHASAADNGPWPTATPDQVTLTNNQQVYIPVLDNDVGQALELFDVNTTTVKLGRVEMDATKTAVYYRSATDFVGEDSFWYAFKDSLGRTNSAKVTLNVIAPVTVEPEIPSDYSAWPTATPDDVSTSKNTAVTIPVLANDAGEDLAITEVNNYTVAGGTATVQGNSIIYNPRQSYTGEDSFWYAFTDARGRTNSSKVTITVSDDEQVTPPVVTQSFNLVTIHDDLLKRRSHIYGESGGILPMYVASYADEGDTEIRVNQRYNLKVGQLITYQSEQGDYYTATVAEVSGQSIELDSPLEAAIDRGTHLWNFYNNGSHPNLYGFRAITDFALRTQDFDELNAGKHVMLGDSWFSSEGIAERLADKLDNAQIVNKGIGGNTSADLLARFDRDVGNQNPAVVWIMAGTNDYYQNVSVADFTNNMSKLISKVQEIGAKAVIIDPSVAPLMSGSESLTNISHEYAAGLKGLLTQ